MVETQRRTLVLATGALAALVAVLPAVAAAQMRPDPEASFNAGLAHLREGRAALALEEFKKAIREDPKNPYFYKGLGLAYARQNKLGDAIAAFRKAMELNPYYVDLRNDLGSVLVLSGKRDEGKAQFLSAFNDPMNPTPEISARNLGQAYFEEKHYDQSTNWYRTSLARNKAYPDAYLGLADTLAITGREDEAVVVLETGAKEAPDSAEMLLRLGQAYEKKGRHPEARARLEEAARKDPGGAVAQRATELLKRVPH
jgi:Tfp pilus assembly protein PilF